MIGSAGPEEEEGRKEGPFGMSSNPFTHMHAIPPFTQTILYPTPYSDSTGIQCEQKVFIEVP
jgi:hypothetical protein